MLKRKLAARFSHWLSDAIFLFYCKQVKIVSLSKEGTERMPSVGKVRTNAVLPTISKVDEKVLNIKLTDERTLNPAQTRFIKDISSHRSIVNFDQVIQKCEAFAASERIRTSLVHKTNSFISMIDFASDFDKVKRPLHIQQLDSMGITPSLLHTVKSFLTCMF